MLYPQITFGSKANKQTFSSYSQKVLREILQAANSPSATITSTHRTPADQARAMV